MAPRIGVDSGGTFTDCVTFRGSRIAVRKVFTDPGAPRLAVEAVRQLAGGTAAAPVILHGTTVGTNALLERRGARVALVTTAGFEDLIEIGRQNRARLYELNPRHEPLLVPRRLRVGVAERVAADGAILLPLRPAALRQLLRTVARSGAEAVAVCLLFSYVNPAHERAIARALRRLDLPLSVSHELLPEFREYERLSTTVINAYLAPGVGAYLKGLEREVRREFAGAKRRARRVNLYVMQSSGGITTAPRACREPVRTILSGPAGGVLATAWLGPRIGQSKLISFDMGGTSTDVCLLDGGPRTSRETTVAGLPVAVPVLDVHTVGAGGGSLARLDAGGALRVGPESAGAVPGPACYGRGGKLPTITDAHLILGRMIPESFLGGGFPLNRLAAERCFDEFLRRARNQLSAPNTWKSRQELAESIIAVANATMEKALRVISVERGYDPREFSLVCFGGAGGLHAAELARSLGLARVIVPPDPGAFSALGVLLADIVVDASQSVLLQVPRSTAIRTASRRERLATASRPRLLATFLQSLQSRFDALERKARAQLRRDGLLARHARVERRLDVRYLGQSYELTVPYTPRFAEEFHRAHERAYGYSDPGRPLEVVHLRARLVVPTPKPAAARQRAAHKRDAAAPLPRRQPAWFSGRALWAAFYDRAQLRPGHAFLGPAVVAEYSATTVVPPGFACRVDGYCNLILTRSRASGKEHAE